MKSGTAVCAMDWQGQDWQRKTDIVWDMTICTSYAASIGRLPACYTTVVSLNLRAHMGIAGTAATTGCDETRRGSTPDTPWPFFQHSWGMPPRDIAVPAKLFVIARSAWADAGQ